MKSYKCPQCGLVGWATLQNCKRCNAPNPLINQTSETALNPSIETSNQQPPVYRFQQTNSPPFSQTSPANVERASNPANYGFYNAPFGSPNMCNLCTQDRGRTAELYGKNVCRKCRNDFSNRRALAFLVDLILLRFAPLVLIAMIGTALDIEPTVGGALILLSLILFFLKDGFGGTSPGKYILGLEVVQKETGERINFLHSLARNIIFIIPFCVLVELVFLNGGARLGDRLSNTRVVWKKYRTSSVFSFR